MAGRHGSVNPIANDQNTAKTNMMDMWRESVQQAQKNREAPVSVAKSEYEARLELEQKIRNGDIPCPTCSARTYQDKSQDSGVSFQAAKGVPASTAGIAVMNHEHEHAAAGKAQEKRDGIVRNSSVSLEYAKCPTCGRTYVAGGSTKTATVPSPLKQSEVFKKAGFDVKA